MELKCRMYAESPTINNKKKTGIFLGKFPKKSNTPLAIRTN